MDYKFHQLSVLFLVHWIEVVSSSTSFSGLQFVNEPQDVVVWPGQQAVLKCSVQVHADIPQSSISISWRKDGASVDILSDKRRFVSTNGSLVISSVVHDPHGMSDVGNYRCKSSVSSVGVILSRKISLAAAYVSPAFEVNPQNKKARLGDSVILMCKISSLPRARIKWMFAAGKFLPVEVQPSSNHHFLTDQRSVLELSPITRIQFGQYYCQVERGEGEAPIFSERSEVTESTESQQQLMFDTRPAAVTTLVKGASVTLLCNANGGPGVTRITWLRGNQPLKVGKNTRFRILGSGSLRVSDVQSSDAGIYSCRATSSSSSSSSSSSEEKDVYSAARLIVHVPPEFVVRPSDAYGRTQRELKLPCEVKGEPTPNIYWMKNGDRVTLNEYFQREGGALRIRGLVAQDSGMFQCVAYNSAGNVQATAQVIVTDDLGLKNEVNLGPPVDLRPVRVGHSYVLLEWKPPTRVPSGVAVRVYHIEVRQVGQDRVRLVSTTSTGYILDKMKPNTAYALRIYGTTGNGARGQPASLDLRTKRAAAVPSPPRNVIGSPQSPYTCLVTWDAPIATGSGPVLKYELLLFNTSQMDADYADQSPARVRPLTYNASRSPLMLRNLQPKAQYRLLLHAVNKEGQSRASEAYFVTFGAKPSGPPRNLSVVAMDTWAALTWRPPAPNHRNGIILTYKFKLREANGRAGKKNTRILRANGSKRSLKVTDLKPRTEYMIRVAARTQNGTGPFIKSWKKFTTKQTRLPGLPPRSGRSRNSEAPVSVRNGEAPPPRPLSLSVRGMSRSIVLSWFKPEPRPGLPVVQSYVIEWGQITPQDRRIEIPGDSESYTIVGLEPNTDYKIRISAHNRFGNSQPVIRMAMTRGTGEPIGPNKELVSIPMALGVDVRGPRAAMLVWTDPDLGALDPIDGRFYQAQVRLESSPDSVGKDWNVTNPRVRLDKLKPATAYTARVRTIKNRGGLRGADIISMWSMSTSFTTKEDKPGSSPTDLSITSRSHLRLNEVQLSWQPPKLSNGRITRYLIHYTANRKLPISEWLMRVTEGNNLNLVVKGLSLSTTYYFQIRAQNSRGFSPYSSVKVYRTPDTSGSGGGEVRLTHKEPDDSGLSGSVSGSRDNASSAGLTDKTWWIIIGSVFLAAMILIAVIIIVICKCRPGAGFERARGSANTNQARKKPLYKAGNKLTDSEENLKLTGGTGSLGHQHNLLPGPSPALKPPDLFIHTAHHLQQQQNGILEMRQIPPATGLGSSGGAGSVAGDSGSERMMGMGSSSLGRRDSSDGEGSAASGTLFGAGFAGNAMHHHMMQQHGHNHHPLNQQQQQQHSSVNYHLRRAGSGHGAHARQGKSALHMPISESIPTREPVALVTALDPPRQSVLSNASGHSNTPGDLGGARQFHFTGVGGMTVAGTVPGTPRVNAAELSSSAPSSELSGYSQNTIVYEDSSQTGSGGRPASVSPRSHQTTPHHYQNVGPQQHRYKMTSSSGGIPQPMKSSSSSANHSRQASGAGGVVIGNGPSTPQSPSSPQPPAIPPHAAAVAAGRNAANESISDLSARAYSTEELSQEMANLEGLMKDLNAMTQKEFEC